MLRAPRTRVRLRRTLRALGPAMSRPSMREALRASLGAGLGLALCGAILIALGAWVGSAPGLLLIAPLGATAFLVFAVPNSPLAQPWSAVAGNSASAFVAISVLHLGLPVELTAGLSVFAAMVAMAVLRAMHPPGAAVALATVLSDPLSGGLGFGFVLAPVMLDTVLLVAFAVLYNRTTGRHYPFRQPAQPGAHATADPPPERRLWQSADELTAVLDRFNLSANIGAEDFGRILAAAEAEAARRHFEDLTCGAVMSRDLVTVAPDTRLGVVADLFRRHRFKSLPVVDGQGGLRGIITQNDLIQRARLDPAGVGAGFAAALTSQVRDRRLRARDIMTGDVRTVGPAESIGVLVRLLADGGVQAAPVVEGPRLVGIVTRSDLIAVLARQTLLAGALQKIA
ncbi:HPP family protein [Oceanibium sediminis]|uniref:HPP family protein n=1 Tax=Oceanibium sediminis TaxID=2026339 RepID=UPI000DD475AC|nr:HPP family protein [Oceanibium sediminis]